MLYQVELKETSFSSQRVVMEARNKEFTCLTVNFAVAAGLDHIKAAVLKRGFHASNSLRLGHRAICVNASGLTSRLW